MKKNNPFLRSFLIATVFLSSVALAAESGKPQPTALEKEMQNIGKNSKALKFSVGDPAKKTEALAEISQIIASAEKSKQLIPKKATEIPEASRPKFIADYQIQINGLIEQFKKIEGEVTAGKTEEAKADFSKLGGIKREGHEKFAAKE